MANLARYSPILLAVVSGWLGSWWTSGLADERSADQAPATYQRPVLIHFEGPITPLLEQYLYRKLDVAQERDADVVIIEIDSPGGFVDSSFNIAHRLRDLDWARTVAFVPRQALSGAAIVALGCDEIVMNPTAAIGDAGPIIQGEDSLFRHAPEKVQSDLALRVRDLAEARERPPALAEAMVDMELVVYEVENRETGDATFMSDAEIASSDDPDVWEKGQPVLESREARFLEVNGRRAVELGLAEGIAADRAELSQVLGLAEPPLVLKATGVDTAVFILNLPLITGLLFVVGLVALYIEFASPGISIGGLIALLCFALFFWSRFLGGTAELLEVVLFVTGVIFIAVEIFVIPGFGVAGIAGALLMLASILMACQGFLVPRTARELGTFSTSLLVIACSGVVFIAAASMLSRYFGSIPILNRLALRPAPSQGSEDDRNKTTDGAKSAGAGGSDSTLGVDVGDWGIAASPLRPAGKARFGDRFLDVMTDSAFVDKGRQVRIVQIQGSRVVVCDVEDV
jgi:membrane-bound serine protease (ClpP class)